MVNSSSKAKILLGKLFVYILIALVVGAGVWFLAISPYLTRQEKSRFESAQSDMKQFLDYARNSIELSTSDEVIESCDRPNMKFTEGPLSCSVGQVLKIKPISIETANDILSSISKLGSGQLRSGPLTSNTMFEVPKKTSPQTIFQDLPDSQRLSCGLSYVYIPAGYRDNGTDELHLRASCGGPARAEHYPVND